MNEDRYPLFRSDMPRNAWFALLVFAVLGLLFMGFIMVTNGSNPYGD